MTDQLTEVPLQAETRAATSRGARSTEDAGRPGPSEQLTEVDMLDKSVTREGTLLYKGGTIYIDGWELNGGGMCREHVIFACLYVAQELMKAANETIAAPGGGKNTCADMPADTPREWLCPDTRKFLAAFDGARVTGDQLVNDYDRGYADGYSDARLSD